MDIVMNILHVACAVFIIGPMAVLPHLAPRLLRGRHGDAVVSLAATTNVFSWLSLLTFIFGFGAMGMTADKYGTSFGDTWIWLSIVLYIIALLLNLLLVAPAMRRSGKAVIADSGATVSAGPIAGGAGVATLCLIVVVVLMVWKP